MNKSELIKRFSEETDLDLDKSTAIVSIFFDSMKKTLLEGGRIEIRGFGSFKVKKYQEYDGRNPKSGDTVRVSAKKLPFFKAGKELKEYINQDE